MKHLQSVYLLIVSLILMFSIISCGEDSKSSTAEVLIFGGGEYHDFDRWFNVEDSTHIAETGASVRYTDNPDDVLPALADIDILNMNTNQSISDPKFPDRIIEFVENGNGLLLVHASTWFIWDWPDYYRDLIGGGSSSHGPLGEFEVYLTDTEHPITQNMPNRFFIKDELYRFQKADDGAEMNILAIGIEPDTGDEYPVIWTVEHGDGRVVNITLGHDGDAHQHEAFVALLQNSINWLN